MENKKSIFPKDFFKQPMPKAKKDLPEDNIPFKWDKKVLTGKSKVKIVGLKEKA